MYIQRHLVVYSKITLKILYILRHLCVYPKPTIDLYIETRLPDAMSLLVETCEKDKLEGPLVEV